MQLGKLVKKALMISAFFVPMGFVQAACEAPAALTWHVLAKVVDGDTLKLADGRSVRLIGINTPELARQGRSAEPFAEQARRALQVELSASGGEVGLLLGRDRQDHYGRTLAHGFTRSGANLEEHLLRDGLGWQVAIAPNTQLAACHLAAERAAQQGKRGVWSRPLSAHVQQAGFQPLLARVKAVQRNRGGIWLELENGAVARIAWAHAKQAWPSDAQLKARQWLVKGWWRDRQREVAASGRARWLVDLQHPSMLREWP